VLARNGKGSSHRGDDDGPRKIGANFCERHPPSKAETKSTQGAIRAELTESDTASALGLIAVSFSPVLLLCRKLIEAGHDPDTPLEAWRSDVQCLRIRSIGEAASLEINGHTSGFKALPEGGWG
jgi:hypothetical protein